MSPELTPAQIEAVHVLTGFINIGLFILITWLFARTRPDIYALKLQDLQKQLVAYWVDTGKPYDDKVFQQLMRFMDQLKKRGADLTPVQVKLDELKIRWFLKKHNAPNQVELIELIANTPCTATRQHFESVYNQLMELTERFLYRWHVLGWITRPFAPKQKKLYNILALTFEINEQVAAWMSGMQKNLSAKADA